jgi:hypothetical protein
MYLFWNTFFVSGKVFIQSVNCCMIFLISDSILIQNTIKYIIIFIDLLRLQFYTNMLSEYKIIYADSHKTNYNL